MELILQNNAKKIVIPRLESEINQLVYAFYVLTATEIEIVEAGGRS